MKVNMKLAKVVGTVSAALVLAACGGGGGGGDGAAADPFVAGSEVPTSATTGAAGAVNFVRAVVNSAAEDKEALVVGAVVLATTETEEPEAV